MITFQEVMRLIFSRRVDGRFKPFKIQFMKFNQSAKTAGEIVDCHAVVVAGNSKVNEQSDATKEGDDDVVTKQHRHRTNKTLNIKLMVAGQPTDQIIKIHPLLILMFNDKEMLL